MTIKNEKFYIIVPEYGENLVQNPVPYQSLTGFNVSNGAQSVDSTYTRRGPACIKVVPSTGVASSVFYSGLPVTAGQPYTFSVDVRGVAGQAMRIFIADSAGANKQTYTFTATGKWQRVSVTLPSCSETVTTYQVYVQRDAVASVEPFWIDGWQFENKAYATTFIYGYEKGLGYIDREYWWKGAPFASASVRSAFTRHGGKLVCINDYALITKAVGLGLGTFENHFTELALGGSVSQASIRKNRNFSFVLTFKGASMDALYANRQAIISAIRPDLAGDQPLVLHYQGYDASGYEATQPVDIICKADVSLMDTPDLPTSQIAVLNFTALDATLTGAYYEGSYLDLRESISVNGIIRKNANGSWDNMGVTTSDIIKVVEEAPNGDIYIGGSFTSINSIANTAKLARFSISKQEWQSVISPAPNLDVLTMKFDATGDLYIGGMFTTVGGKTVNYIAKLSNLYGTPATSTLGTGMNSEVDSIDIDANGMLYAGGNFTTASGTTVNYIAKWDGSNWSALGSGVNNKVYSVFCHWRSDYVIIGGLFTDATGTDGDYIAYYSNMGTPGWHKLSAFELNNQVRTIDCSSAGNLIVGGWFTIADGGSAGTITLNHIAGFNGNNWYGFQEGVNGNVSKIQCLPNGGFYMCGGFTEADPLKLTDNIVRWQRGAWQAIDIDLPYAAAVYNFTYTDNGELIIVGSFSGSALTGKVANNVLQSNASADVYPIIQIKGPGALQHIINTKLQKQIDFIGLILQPGEYINLWLDPHNLKFESSWKGRGSVLDYIAAGSDVADFNLEPGTNNIAVFMPTGTTSDTKVWIRWQPKFWSLDGATL